jgi:hypothetical protein
MPAWVGATQEDRGHRRPVIRVCGDAEGILECDVPDANLARGPSVCALAAVGVALVGLAWAAWVVYRLIVHFCG